MQLSKAFKSLRKTIKKEEAKLGKKQTSGKDVMTFECYKFTCKKMLSSGLPEDIFALSFLTLQWNLMSRSESTEMLSINNLRWEEDHIKIFFPKHKSDQGGLTSNEPRHVYSNSIEPSICPVRALAAYLIAYPGVLSAHHGRLFPGENQKKRFGKQLSAILKRYYHEYQDIGVTPEDIGTHSIRKGAATYCTCAVHPGPPIVSVCLRAGWTIGRVKERYLKYEAAGDQLVGRCLAGIDPQNNRFSNSPVFFYNLNKKTEHQLRQLQKYSFPVDRGAFSHTARMLLANYIFNEAFHQQKVKNERSMLRDNTYYAYRNCFPWRLFHVRTSCPWDGVAECPSYTGIPLHCSILNKLIEVHQLQKKLPGDIASLVKTEIHTAMGKKKDTDKEKEQQNEVEQLKEELAKMSRLLGEAMETFKSFHKEADGTKKKTVVSVEYNTDNETITLESEADTDDANDADNALPASELAGKENKITKMKTFGVWAHYWDGKIRKVPKTFQFPKGKPLLSVFLDWHLPNIDKKHPPLHALDSYDVANVNRGTQRLSELKLVMNTFITFIKQEASAKIRKLYEGGKKNLSILTEVFDACKHLYLQEKPTRRIEQMSWESFVTESRNWKLRGYPTITHKPTPPRKPRAPRVSRTTTSSTSSKKKLRQKKQLLLRMHQKEK